MLLVVMSSGEQTSTDSETMFTNLTTTALRLHRPTYIIMIIWALVNRETFRQLLSKSLLLKFRVTSQELLPITKTNIFLLQLSGPMVLTSSVRKTGMLTSLQLLQHGTSI